MNNSLSESSHQEIRHLLDNMVGRRVAVIGDVMLDEHLLGQVRRISPEAPVPVLDIEHEKSTLGGAANVAACLAALGAEVQLCGVIGDDAASATIHERAEQSGINTTGLVADSTRPTTCKTRVVAGQQQVVRMDRETREPISGEVAERVIERARNAVLWSDAVILSDYAKGVLSEELCQTVIKAAQQRPVIVDPKALPWDRYRGATVVKPNRHEIQQYLRQDIDTDERAATAACRLADDLELNHALLTRGADGMTLATRQASSWETQHVRATRRELVDVTGAGDVTSAVLALSLAAGAQIGKAMCLSNLAAGVKVAKFGAATVSSGEILAAVGSGRPKKVLSVAEAVTWSTDLRARGKRVVFTNGCFDLLHAGHVHYLEASRRLGDALIVGLNSDASVQRLKGPSRPVQSQDDRARILGSLSAIDAVTVFDEDTPFELIRAIRPDVITKGKDYHDKHAVVGWNLVESWGGTVELIEFVAGHSTTKLINRAAA